MREREVGRHDGNCEVVIAYRQLYKCGCASMVCQCEWVMVVISTVE